jgi:uncharacterized membrane protein
MMKKILGGMISLALVMAVGCTKEEPSKGGSLTVKAPAAADLKPGEKQDVKVAVERGKDMKDEVTVKIEAPKGITVEPESKVLAAADKDLSVKVGAAADATEGKQTVTITATPKGGKAVTSKFDVNVKKGEAKPEKPEAKENKEK